MARINRVMNRELLTRVIGVGERLMQVLDFLFASVRHDYNQCHSKHSQCNTEDDGYILF